MRRKTDNPRSIYFHANRIHRTNGLWYFETREGANIGPFESKVQVERQLAVYVVDLVSGSPDHKSQ